MALASSLRELTMSSVKPGAISIRIDTEFSAGSLINAIKKLRATPPECIKPKIDERAIRALKFSECLSPEHAEDVLTARYADPAAIQICLKEDARVQTITHPADRALDFY